MTIDHFINSLNSKSPPNLDPKLMALWYDGRQDWEQAHQIAQDIEDEQGAAIHAYLHRKEKDQANANYWYARAKRSQVKTSLEEEWYSLAKELMESSGSR